MEEGQDAHVWGEVQVHDYDRRQLFRIDLASDGSKAAHSVGMPPGLDVWPKPGELIVSPRFAQEAARSETLSAFAPGEVVGIVGGEGLRAPDELVVYRGATKEELGSGGEPVAGFGGNAPVNQELEDSQIQGLSLFFITCLGLPVGAFLVVASRLSASTRLRGIAALRLIGVSARQAARITAVEQVVVGFLGALLALSVYPLVNHYVAGSGLLVIKWYPETTSVGPFSAAVVIGVCSGISWFVGSRSNAAAIHSPWAHRRSAPPRPTALWRVFPLAVGAAALWFLAWQGFFAGRNEDGSPLDTSLWMISAVLLTGLGLLLAAGTLTELICRWWKRSCSLTRRLGAARAGFDAQNSGKLAAGVLVLVFAIGVGIGHSRDARATSELEAGVPAKFSARGELIEEPQARRLMKIEGTLARSLIASEAGTGARVLFTDCAGLHHLAGKQVADCGLDRGEGYRLQDRRQSISLVSSSGHPVEVPSPSRKLTQTGGLLGHSAVLPLDSKLAYSAYGSVELVADFEAMDEVMSQFVAIAPYSQPSVFGENPAQAEINSMLGAYIRFAFVLGGLVALMALVVALLDRAVQRRRVNARMLAQGMRPGQLRAVQAWEAAASMVPQVALAWLLGIVGAMTWQYTGGLIRTPDWVAFGWLTLGTLVAVATAVAIAAFSTPRRVEPQLLRAE
ncbi:ABC transporter permease [Streptomyces sp. XM4193]|uniref:FtsX-like permease family protein n=1 Tax=Streptomyces sp. XM4193 TaxID=2929782 RepID=UPI001FFB7854|nr:ABC transporter permease [Streptomyces sp. XM4193]MCK1795460.1 ABC transporter permease [Streptomyces sp. XM4193]